MILSKYVKIGVPIDIFLFLINIKTFNLDKYLLI